MTMLQSIFGNKSTPDALRAKLARLESEENDLSTAYQDFALAAADDTDKQKDADKAHAAFVAHQQRIERTRAALNAAERVHAQAQRDLEAGVTAAAWDGFVAASKAREPAALEVAELCEKLGAAIVRLHDADVKVHQAVPPGVPSHTITDYIGGVHERAHREVAANQQPGTAHYAPRVVGLHAWYCGVTERLRELRDDAINGPREEAA